MGSLSSRSPAKSHRWNKETRSSCFELIQFFQLIIEYLEVQSDKYAVLLWLWSYPCSSPRMEWLWLVGWFLLHWVTLPWLGPNTALVLAPFCGSLAHFLTESVVERTTDRLRTDCVRLGAARHTVLHESGSDPNSPKHPWESPADYFCYNRRAFQLFHLRNESANLWVWPILIYQQIAWLCTQFWPEVLRFRLLHTS